MSDRIKQAGDWAAAALEESDVMEDDLRQQLAMARKKQKAAQDELERLKESIDGPHGWRELWKDEQRARLEAESTLAEVNLRHHALIDENAALVSRLGSFQAIVDENDGEVYPDDHGHEQSVQIGRDEICDKIERIILGSAVEAPTPPKLINPVPNPRYDDVYEEGVKMLNEDVDGEGRET